MVRIYALKNGEEVLYVGKTIRTLEKRAVGHRSSSNQAGSKHIAPEVQWEIALLEECGDDIATERERHYVETLKPPYNKRIPGRTKAEYNQTEAGKAAQKAYMTEYRQTEAAKAANREYVRLYRERKAALLQANGE